MLCLADGFTPDVSRTVLQPPAVLGRDPKGGRASAKGQKRGSLGGDGGGRREAARTVLVLFWGLELKFVQLIPSQCELNYF